MLVKPKKTGREAKQIGQRKPELEKQQSKLAEPSQKLQEQSGCACCAVDASCFVAGTPVVTSKHGLLPMEANKPGTLVRTYLPQKREQLRVPEPERFDRADLRLIRLVMWRGAGGRVDIELLRLAAWVEDQRATAGGAVFLDMRHMGVRGQAAVISIDASQELEEGEGSLVTGTFSHTSGQVYNLKIESENHPIGATGSHPFWTADRRRWVAVAELLVGERVKTLNGSTKIESRILCAQPETVYNLEIEGDNCFRIGGSGVLVHNASAAYRLGGKTAKNLTPRPGKDDGATKGGLSFTECPGKGWMFAGGKARLQALGFETEDDPTDDDPTHFLVRPAAAFIANGWTLQKWAAARPDIDEDDRSTWPEPTVTLFTNAQPFNT